jgi:hypothetical protein
MLFVGRINSAILLGVALATLADAHVAATTTKQEGFIHRHPQVGNGPFNLVLAADTFFTSGDGTDVQLRITELRSLHYPSGADALEGFIGLSMSRVDHYSKLWEYNQTQQIL